jgi:hypothetical protein
MRMLVVVLASLAVLAVVVTPAPVWAFNCPVAIKQADDLIRKAEGGTLSPETRPLLDEAKKQLAEAKAHHANAKMKRDHGDAIRKAKVAAAFAEEAIPLQNP